MFTKSIEINQNTKRFHIVTAEELPSGEWYYIRKSGGLTLKTQKLDYYFQGIQEKGYKTEKYAKKVLKRLSEEG